MTAGEGGGVPQQPAPKDVRTETGMSKPAEQAPLHDTDDRKVNPVEDQQLADLAEQNPPVVETGSPAEELVNRADLVISPEKVEPVLASAAISPGILELQTNVPGEEEGVQAMQSEDASVGEGVSESTSEQTAVEPASQSPDIDGQPEGETPAQATASTTAPDLRVEGAQSTVVAAPESVKSQPIEPSVVSITSTETVPVAPLPTGTSAEAPKTLVETAPSTQSQLEANPPAAGAATEGGRGATPPLPEVNPPQPEAENLQEEIKTALQGNKEYEAAKKALETDANKRSRVIDAMPEDQKITALDANKGEKKAYEKYVEQRERVYMAERRAEWDIREKQLHALEEAIKGLPSGADRTEKEQQLLNGRKELEKDRQKTEAKSALDGNAHYQDLRRKYRKAEHDLVELYVTNGKTKEEAEEMVRDLAGKKWEDLSDAEKKAFGKDKDFFNKSYSFDRSDMNGAELRAKNKIVLQQMERGIDADGSKIPPDQIPARVQEYFESRATDKRQGPGKIRKGFRWFESLIEDGFGELALVDHRRKAFGHAKNLISEYGWRGVLAQWLLPENKRETAKTLRNLMIDEMKAYGVRRSLRTFLQFIRLAILFWIILPVAIGKGLELTKPFGGNG